MPVRFLCVCVCLTASRCFALIDSSTLEQTRDETETDAQTHLDSLVELGLSSTVSTVLTQCSADIYQVRVRAQTHTHTHTWQLQRCVSLQVALQKIYTFATSSVFETCVSGRMVADVCRAAAKVGSCCRGDVIAVVMSPSHAHPVASRLQCHPAEALRLFVPHCCSAISHSQYRRQPVCGAVE